MGYSENQKVSGLEALEDLAERAAAKLATKQEVKELSDKVDGLVNTGGEPNKIEKIKVNGAEQDIVDKAVDITVPQKVTDLSDHTDYLTEEQIDAKLSSVYKPMGSSAFLSLPTPDVNNVGNVYNVTDTFTTDTKFVEDSGKNYPAGTNVVVVYVDETYKYDVLSGMVDLTNYVEKDGNKQLSDENYTIADKTKLAGIKDNATKVEKSETSGNILIDGVETPVVTFASEEEVLAMLDRVLPLEG